MQIEGLGARFSGTYFVTETTHTIGDSGYTTKFNARREDEGKEGQRMKEDNRRRHRHRHRASTTRERQGRIQLQFPWLSEVHRSAWAPVAAPMAGKKRGAFFMPELDDEVLVAFEHGDFDHPFIIGFLWNGVDTPPETNQKNRVIKTPGGHTCASRTATGKKIDHQIELRADDQRSTISERLRSRLDRAAAGIRSR